MSGLVDKLRHGLFAAVALSVTLTATAVKADEYPDRPVSMTVVYSPGGATDFQARIVTMVAANKQYLKQPIVILNRPGAGGRVGWNYYASKAKIDGYELAAYNVPHFIAQSIMFDTKYNIGNLEPIANWGADPAVLVVSKKSPFNSVADMVAFAKKNPGKVTVSGAGLYVGHHIAFLQIAKATGTKMTYVPFKGGAPALKSVLGGQVMAGINNLSDAYRSRNNLKIIGIADLHRNTQFLPNVPTFKEQGYDVDDSSVNFRGIMVRKGTPQKIIDKLAAVFPKMFENKRVIKQMTNGGSPIRVIKRDALKKMWAERQVYLTKLLSGLKK